MSRLGPRLLLAAVLIALPATLLAGQWPHERQGVVLGFGLGGGSAQLEYEGSTTIPGDDPFVLIWSVSSEREGGVAAGARFGWAFNSKLVLGLEAAGWERTFDGVLGDETWSFGVSTIALTWFPQGGGFYLRGGVGAGRAKVEIKQNSSSVSAEETGAGALLGLGYEWRLTRRFALGPALDFSAVDLDDSWKANFTGVTVTCNWYL